MEDTKDKIKENVEKTDREIWDEQVRAFKDGIEAQEAERKKAAELKKEAAREAKAAEKAKKEAEKKASEEAKAVEKAKKEAEKKASEEAKAAEKAKKEAEKKAAGEAKAAEKAQKAAEKKSAEESGAAEKAQIETEKKPDVKEVEKKSKEEKLIEREEKDLKAAVSAEKEKKDGFVRTKRRGVKKGKDTDGTTIRVKKIKKNRIKQKLIFFIILAAALLFVSIFARLLCPYDPYKQDLSQALQSPSASHLLGTDRYGRDLLSRIIMGSQASIYSTLLLVLIVSVIGTIVGVICGWKGGKVDAVLMRISDIFLAFPELVFALAVAGVLGGGIQNAIIAMAAVAWPKYARIARSQTLAQKETPYMHAARLSGDTTSKMIFRHILPNILGPLLVTAMLDIGTMMMGLSGLSYLGLGVMPPTAEWGSMMSESRSMLQMYPWVTLSPGVAIFVSVMIFNLLGDTVRDYMDPKQRTK